MTRRVEMGEVPSCGWEDWTTASNIWRPPDLTDKMTISTEPPTIHWWRLGLAVGTGALLGWSLGYGELTEPSVMADATRSIKLAVLSFGALAATSVYQFRQMASWYAEPTLKSRNL